jgi:hypothetical protein
MQLAMDFEGPEKAIREGRRMNGSQSKFLSKTWSISWIQNPKETSCKKVIKTPTNRIEMIPKKIRTQRKKNRINPTHG